MIHLTIPISPVTKKNSQQIVMVKGRPIIMPSQRYRSYERACEPFLEELSIDYPITLACHYYMPTKRRVDLVNLLEATCDVLVKYKVISDDNSRVVASHDGSRVFYDKENPRTEIFIEEFSDV